MPSVVKTYEQAIEFLYGRINYERVPSTSPRDFKLDRMRRLLDLIDQPQTRIPVVHIAGTKGKGSTATMVAEILCAAGLRVGLFTSPHISAFEERIRVDGFSPGAGELVDLVNRIAGPVRQMDDGPQSMWPTYFEIATALAWLHFRDQSVQLAVMEVGLGGRLDATNICRPEVCVITNISRDHTAVLGDTPAQIAGEKAGIVKSGVPVVNGTVGRGARRVIEDVARLHRAPLFQLWREIKYRRHPNGPGDRPKSNERDNTPYAVVDVETPFRRWVDVPVVPPGEHQAANAALALATVDVLKDRGWSISTRAVYSGMAKVRCPLRIEVVALRPTVVVDSAHNAASVAALVKTLNQYFRGQKRLLIFAVSKDKDVSALLKLLLPEFDTIILTRYLNNPRAVGVDRLCRLVRSMSVVTVHTTDHPRAAWTLADTLARPDDVICVTGSFFIAAEVRELVAEARRRTGCIQDDRQASTNDRRRTLTNDAVRMTRR